MKKLSLLTIAATAFLVGCQTADKPLTAQGLFDRHVEASYGPDGLEGTQSTEFKGNLVIAQFGLRAPVTLRAMAPNHSSMKTQVMGTNVGNGCSGDTCWDQQPGQGVQNLSGDRLEFSLQQSDYYLLTRIGNYYDTLVMDPVSEGATTRSVTATRANGDVDSFVFDIETGLLASTTMQTPTPQGKFSITMNYKNYQTFDGIQVATEVEQITPVATIGIEVNEVAVNTLADDDFAAP